MDDPEPYLLLASVGLCLLLLAFTSAVDAAFTSISRHRLNAMINEGAPRARALSRFLDDPYRLKATVLLLNTTATIVAALLVLRLTSAYPLWWQLGSMVLLLLAILVFGESVPKALAMRYPDGTASRLVRPLRVMSWLVWPLVALVHLISRPFNLLLTGKDTPNSTLVTEEEIRLLVNVGEEEGLIKHDEREMIEGIFTFGDTLVREIMVPRVDIIALHHEATIDDAIDTVVQLGHSRIPVYNETLDQIEGILYAKDLLAHLRNGRRDTPINSLLRPAYFVPETVKVDMLLQDLQQRKVHIAIIVDEYGGTAGLATIEDLIEEIVGEIQDEYDVEEPSIQAVNESEAVVDGRMPIDDINDLLGLDLRSTENDRIGGLVVERLGHVPRVGDTVELEGVTATVLSVKGVRPQQLRLAYPQRLELELRGAQEGENREPG